MRLIIRLIDAQNNSIDRTIESLDVTKVPAATAGSPTASEVMFALSNLVFDGATFPKSIR